MNRSTGFGTFPEDGRRWFWVGQSFLGVSSPPGPQRGRGGECRTVSRPSGSGKLGPGSLVRIVEFVGTSGKDYLDVAVTFAGGTTLLCVASPALVRAGTTRRFIRDLRRINLRAILRAATEAGVR